MSQFVIEAHISRLWCFYSRFNRAGVSVSYPFTFLLLSAFRKTKKRKKETVTSTEEMKTAKFTRFRRRAYVCVCEWSRQFSWESVKWKEGVINLTTAFWLNRRKRKNGGRTLDFLRCDALSSEQQKKTKRLPMMMNCNTFEFDFDCRSCLHSPFVYQLRETTTGN